MRKILFSLVAFAAIFGAASGVAFAEQYPPCKSRSDDRCTQSPSGMMAPAGHKAKMMGHKTGKMGMKAGHKAAKMGKEMKTKMAPAGEMAPSGSASPPTTHGCSPATTPCQ